MDAYKRLKGRKRHIVVDTQGYLLDIELTAASVQDRHAAQALLRRVKTRFPSLAHVWVDASYQGVLQAWASNLIDLTLEVVARPPAATGFQVLPRRWVVERTFAWLGRYRRLSKDYEYLVSSSKAMLYLAMSNLMLNRLSK